MDKRDIKNYTRSYWDGRAKAFANFRKNEYMSIQHLNWTKELSSKLDISKGKRILDVGCGSGFLSAILANMGFEVYAVDMSERMIAEAKEFANSNGLEINFAVMDAERLEFADESFDYVISRNVTWNLPDPEKAYKEWLRVLKTGGCLVNYDAEYAKNYSVERNQKHAAHVDCTEEQLNAIGEIYDSLEVSRFNRPKWDADFFTELGYSCVIDDTISNKIYKDINSPFYVSEKMFCVICHK